MKKKSKWNRMIYLAVIFALLLLLYLFLKNRNEKAEDAESSGMDVIQMDTSSIVNFSFKIGDNFAEFSKDGDEWKNQEDSEFPVDQEAVETLLNDLLSFPPKESWRMWMDCPSMGWRSPPIPSG